MAVYDITYNSVWFCSEQTTDRMLSCCVNRSVPHVRWVNVNLWNLVIICLSRQRCGEWFRRCNNSILNVVRYQNDFARPMHRLVNEWHVMYLVRGMWTSSQNIICCSLHVVQFEHVITLTDNTKFRATNKLYICVVSRCRCITARVTCVRWARDVREERVDWRHMAGSTSNQLTFECIAPCRCLLFVPDDDRLMMSAEIIEWLFIQLTHTKCRC